MLRVMTNCPPTKPDLIQSASATKWHKTVGLRLGGVLDLGVRSPNVSVHLVRVVPFCRTR